jgi:hypothetical protein
MTSTDTEQRAQQRLTRERYTPRPPVVADIEFGDPETITVADLRAGDFLICIPDYRNVRGVQFNSAVKTISDPSYERGWYERGTGRGRRVPKFPVMSRELTTHAGSAGWDFPVATPVVVRRPAVRPLTLDEQIEQLREQIAAAERDTIADQGDEVLDAGGWVEVTRAVLDLAGPEISDEAKREVRRMSGLVDVEQYDRDDEMFGPAVYYDDDADGSE